ncbi:MAG: hypothetical protein A2Y24_04130 [Clostridiales bacterium GWE2_32_10]|nr:MAG: hypothetical protein A2Y24_04130 [Clostridiales bacterium GWE2_32_10]HBY21693.1 hypothetical protein [Clostridiales bacterium]
MNMSLKTETEVEESLVYRDLVNSGAKLVECSEREAKFETKDGGITLVIFYNDDSTDVIEKKADKLIWYTSNGIHCVQSKELQGANIENLDLYSFDTFCLDYIFNNKKGEKILVEKSVNIKELDKDTLGVKMCNGQEEISITIDTFPVMHMRKPEKLLERMQGCSNIYFKESFFGRIFKMKKKVDLEKILHLYQVNRFANNMLDLINIAESINLNAIFETIGKSITYDFGCLNDCIGMNLTVDKVNVELESANITYKKDSLLGSIIEIKESTSSSQRRVTPDIADVYVEDGKPIIVKKSVDNIMNNMIKGDTQGKSKTVTCKLENDLGTVQE